MILILFSLFLWTLIFVYVKKYPICGVSYEERGGGGSGGQTEVTSHTNYYYRVKLPHNSIDPSKEIILYDSTGTSSYTIPAYSSSVNYGSGVIAIPGTEQNTQAESIATATYYVFYASSDLIIDYDKAEIKVVKTLVKSPTQSSVSGTFQYLSVITPFKDVASVIDGRWDTQVQTEFFAEPPTGYNYSILDLGSTKTIQAIDIVAGFYKPDEVRKFDVDFNLTLQYSTDGTNYYDISDKTNNVKFNGGEAQQFEEEDLGIGFQARYLKMIIENVKKVAYGEVKDANGTVIRDGVYVVAITEIAAYDNIALKSEAKLIPTTTLSADIVLSGLTSGEYPTTLNVVSTEGFDSSGTAYIWDGYNSYDVFSYTGKGATFFTGVSGLSFDYSSGDYIIQEIAGDSSVYDYEGLLSKLGDRIYKVNKVNDEVLFTQAQLDYVAKSYLQEFNKNHTKNQIEMMFAPHISVGDTVKLVDSTNNINRNYFVESVTHSDNITNLVLAYYPGA